MKIPIPGPTPEQLERIAARTRAQSEWNRGKRKERLERRAAALDAAASQLRRNQQL